MNLFEDIEFIDPLKNLLPYNGTVNYFGKVLSSKDALYYFKSLFDSLNWENDVAVMYGKKIITKRKVAWYGDEPYEYTYSNFTKQAMLWVPQLLELKQLVEKTTGETFNSCLCNLYHSGEEGMAWHSDGEKDLKKNGAIASLSLGAQRKFAFKHKETNKVISMHLESGSLLIMKDEIQSHWLHRLPPTKKVTTPRINLTFRTIVK